MDRLGTLARKRGKSAGNDTYTERMVGMAARGSGSSVATLKHHTRWQQPGAHLKYPSVSIVSARSSCTPALCIVTLGIFFFFLKKLYNTHTYTWKETAAAALRCAGIKIEAYAHSAGLHFFPLQCDVLEAGHGRCWANETNKKKTHSSFPS